ncbi:hypothetical protein HBB16_02090 [Pseudonocardia sp. MCCB 268]|nr:hypothetical protein [Pseudonocardia cytotoxica]
MVSKLRPPPQRPDLPLRQAAPAPRSSRWCPTTRTCARCMRPRACRSGTSRSPRRRSRPRRSSCCASSSPTTPSLVVLARYMQVLSDEACRSASTAGPSTSTTRSLPGFAGARPYHQAYERGGEVVGATALRDPRPRRGPD